MGTPQYAAVSLRRLLAGPHRVVAVITRADKPRGRGQQLVPSPVKELALSAGIRVFDPVTPRSPELLAQLRELAPDIGVTVAYGRILPPDLLAIPRFGCINAHGSLLPALRGAAPIERAILCGLDTTGVTIMQMSEGLDEGDMIDAREVPIGPDMNADELRAAMAEVSAQMLAETVDRYASGPVPQTPQDHSRATFAPPLRKEEAAIQWNAPADVIARQVRAFAPRPGAYAFDGTTRLKVLAAKTGPDPVLAGAAKTGSGPVLAGTIVGRSEEGLLVACGSGTLLELRTVQPEGKRAMSALDYDRGCRGADPHRVLLPGLPSPAASSGRDAAN